MWGLYKSMFIAATSVMRCHENFLHKGPAAAGLFPLKNSREKRRLFFWAMCPDEGHGHYNCFYCGAIKNYFLFLKLCLDITPFNR